MQKNTVKRCVRPQCMGIFSETTKNRFCLCGALLQTVEIEIKPQKNKNKLEAKDKSTQKNLYTEAEVLVKKTDCAAEDVDVEVLENSIKKIKLNDLEKKDFTNADDTRVTVYKESVENDTEKLDEVSFRKAFLYVLLENEDVKFEINNIARIGRVTEDVQVDINLAEYAGKEISREHAIIRKEKEGYYITNVSRNHSVRIIGQDNNEVALEYGKKVLLKSEDGILLSKKVLLQFVEEE